ncbi:hypothetical protein [Streptomyces sp. COG21]|uniref:hypothetical protein n=1 Tax=Streptomyces sp. COG21 TaxID=2838872 RepID=UPI000AE9C1A1
MEEHLTVGRVAELAGAIGGRRRAVDRLQEDLSSGRWAERNRDLAALDAAELGLRLIVA